MGFKKIFILLFIFIFFASKGFCDISSQSKFSQKLNLKSPDAVSKQANSFNSDDYEESEVMKDPITNSVINGYVNNIMMMNNASYSGEEMRKQQADYVRQQYRE